MSQIKSNLLFCLALSLIILSCGRRDNPVDRFEESRPGSVRAFYAYPSTVRMLGKIVDSDNPNRFESIEKARLFIEWKSDDADSREQFMEVKNEALSEKFEELFTMSSTTSDLTILIDDSQTPVYLLFSFSEDVDYILELKGNISMNTLKEMGTLDLENMANIIDLGMPAEEENSEIQEN